MGVQAGAPLAESGFAAWAEELARQSGTTALLDLLDERHRIYEEQTSQRIVRMRGWILVLLSRAELPAAALPFVLEELDTSLDAYLVGAAAIALRAYPQPAPEFAPFVLRALDNIRGRDQPLSFDRYGEYAVSEHASSAVRELLGTTAWLGRQGKSLTPRLLALRDAGTQPPRLREALDIALRAADRPGASDASNEACCPFVMTLGRRSWLSSVRRHTNAIEGTVFEDQTGTTTTYHELFTGRPSIVTFFYTRCDNPLKCSLTIWKLARVQKLLESRGVAGRVGTAAITYDPAFDLPDRLRIFGRNRDLRMDPDHRLLRAVDGIAPLRSYFGLGVGFADGLVNRHRLEVFLLDDRGRIARSFQRLHWDEARVVDEAVALLSEPAATRAWHGWSRLSAAGPLAAVVVACLPKCPLCWSAYLSSAGLGAFAWRAHPGARQLVGLLLLAHLASIFWRARSTRRWSGFVLSLAGTAMVVATFVSAADVQTPGTALVAAGALVSALGRRPSQWMTRIMRSRLAIRTVNPGA